MATYILGTIGSIFGGPIGGAIGAALGSFADRALINALTPTQRTTNTGPRLAEMSLTTSTEGAVLPRLYGRCRMGGQVIWAADFKETVETETQEVGGKGGGGQEVTTKTYSYSLSFAVAFCEGSPTAGLGRVWLDSSEADLSKYTFRFYPGSRTQEPDPLIQAIEGAGVTPAYRGTCYLVFEDLPLESFGNRMPQVTVEIVAPLDTGDPDDLVNAGRAYQLIPGTGETAYATSVVKLEVGGSGYWNDAASGSVTPDNMHNNFREPDVTVAIDQLIQMQPNLAAISIVVSWFGTDLRAGHCRVVPKIESRQRDLEPNEWLVAGIERADAEIVTQDEDGRPIFGGTPSDESVKQLIEYIRGKGLRVMFYPFLLMDVPAGNTLPTPYSDNAATTGQPVFPWRGRITQSPAVGYAGSPDKTTAAATQVAAFFDGAEGYARMIRHYAALCADAGGVDAFIVGSELVGLTTVRSGAGAGPYPAVDHLCALADEVKATLGTGTKVSYAADWSEYHSHRPDDGSGDVIFALDKLWARASVDFVGIDNYLPIADWRDGDGHLDFDAQAGPRTTFDRAYLAANVEGGEYFDWYYASSADRDAQIRTPIVDTAYGKAWTFRQKDIRSWWQNVHLDRIGGVEAGSATDWTAGGKPIWFTEFGCPAVDKGPNQPNVFYDPKSSESFFPYHSSGVRDDAIQRVYCEVMLAYWRDHAPAGMLSAENMFIWCWDARPFPEFPLRSDIWSDGDSWLRGHWLSGRLDGAVLSRLVRKLCRDAGLDDARIDVSGLDGPAGLVRGFLVADQSSQRDIIEQLGSAYQFDGFESGDKLTFRMGINTPIIDVEPEDLVLADDVTYPVTITRAQETDLPRTMKISYFDELNDFQVASVDGQKGTGTSLGISATSFPLVLTVEYARALANAMLQRIWAARESGEVSLPPSYAAAEVGDALFVPLGARTVSARIDRVDLAAAAALAFSGFDSSIFATPGFDADLRLPARNPLLTSITLEWLDIPLASAEEPLPHAPRLAATASPWPGAVNLLIGDGAGGFALLQSIGSRAMIGRLAGDLYSGPVNRWDRVNSFDLELDYGGLSSLSEEQLLSGTRNVLAVRDEGSGEWEVLQFASAELIGTRIYRLSTLLRGMLGSEHAMMDPNPAGARAVVLDRATIVPLQVSKPKATVPTPYRWGPAPYASTDPTYLQGTRFGRKTGLRPYSPCDLRIRRVAATDDLELSWKRRTRLGGDSWDQVEVPLSEEGEQYRLQILSGDGATVLRTAILTAPAYTYAAAAMTADLGSPQTAIRLRLAQYGAEFGDYGVPLDGTFYMGSSR